MWQATYEVVPELDNLHAATRVTVAAVSRADSALCT
jgi:hypothetical protein